MKKLLFSLIITAGLSPVVNAQTVWDFNDTTKFSGTGISTTTTIDGLIIVPGTSSITGFNTQNSGTFPDGYSATQRLQMGGTSYSNGTNDPTNGGTVGFVRRYLEIPITEPVRIKVWARGGGANRKLIITDGVAVVGSLTFAGSEAAILSADYNGTETKLQVGMAIDQSSLFKVEVTPLATLAATGVNKPLAAQVFSTGKLVNIKGLESKNTLINVYSTNGNLVKSLKTSADTNFEINQQGVYIVTLKSDAGEKSVKVMIK